MNAAQQHAADMKAKTNLRANVESATALLTERAAKVGHVVTTTKVQQTSRAVVGFCDRCNKDAWVHADGRIDGDVFTRPCK